MLNNKIIKTIKNPLFKNILLAIGIAICGYILLNLTFLLYYLFQTLIDLIIKNIAQNLIANDINRVLVWYPPVKHFLFVVSIGIISYYIFHSKIKPFYKATFLVVPIAVVLVTFGIFFYQWPMVSYLLGIIFSIGVLYYLYRRKMSWLYYYAVILISVTLLIFTLLGGEI